MPRDIPVGNGTVLVCFDRDYCIRDLYFPHVGQENHISGRACRFGVWTENRFSWVGRDWNLELRYDDDTLVTSVNLHHKELGLLLICRDAVDFHENVYLREISVENLVPRAREVRLFFTHDFEISGNSVGDTAAFDPRTGGVVHYKGPRYFLTNAFVDQKGGISQFATGQKGVGGREGTFRDAEDGLLSGNTIAQGSVDSVISLALTVEGHSQSRAYYWVAAGQSWQDVRRLDALVKERHPRELLKRTADYWTIWVRKETPPLEALPREIGAQYRRSLLVMRTQIDHDGGIIAANDSDVIQFNRDTYSYVWPRDAALAANALDLAGYPALSQRFFSFIARLIEREGYLLHKYNPDGTLASSWHPWFNGGQAQLPIQEDETALVLWALWKHFVLSRDLEFIKPLYRSLIKKAADFMCEYRDKETGLPEASYDLWEERRGVLSFTVGAVFGGLTAASLFCTVFGETAQAEHYQNVAARIRDGATTHLWRPEVGRFCRMLHRSGEGRLQADTTPDASLWGLFAFGLYSVQDPRIEATMSALREALWVKTTVGGVARYQNDGYHRTSSEVPGNPWFVCSLWLADYLAEKAQDRAQVEEAISVLRWASEHTLASGVMPEQLHPFSGEPLSISPLTWSHATFVATTQRILHRLGKLNICIECATKLAAQARSEDWIGRLYAQTCDTIHGTCKIN